MIKKNNKTENPRNAATFVGNRPLHTLDLVGPDKKTLRQKYLIGEPCDCPSGTAQEMKSRGYVGIYLKSPVLFFRLPNSGRIIQKTW